MQYRYPKSYEHRKAELERRLRELLVDYRRLMQFIPQIPDQIGEPFSGPLDPIQFEFFPEVNTGGTNTFYVPSGTTNNLPNRVIVTISGVQPGVGSGSDQDCCASIDGAWSCIYDPGPFGIWTNDPPDNICGYRINVSLTIDAGTNSDSVWSVRFDRNIAPSIGSVARYQGFGNIGELVTCSLIQENTPSCVFPSTCTVQSQ